MNFNYKNRVITASTREQAIRQIIASENREVRASGEWQKDDVNKIHVCPKCGTEVTEDRSTYTYERGSVVEECHCRCGYRWGNEYLFRTSTRMREGQESDNVVSELRKAFDAGFAAWVSEVKGISDDVIDVRYTVNNSLQNTADTKWDDKEAMWNLISSTYVGNGSFKASDAFADYELYGNYDYADMPYAESIDCGIRIDGTELKFYVN